MRYFFWVLLPVFAFIFILSIVSGVNAEEPDLFISEYIEGTSNNKAIEIFNPSSGPIDLSGYKIQSYINGSLSVSATATTAAVINPGNVFVVCNSLATTAILNVCNLKISGVGTVMTFNGDDALVLAKSDGTPIDIIGQIGFDPGSEWGSGLTSTSDNTLKRKCTITGGDLIGTDVFDPAIEWDGFATDSFDSLGSFSSCTPTGSPSPEPTNTPAQTPFPSPTISYSPSPTPSPSSEATFAPTTTPTPTNSPTPNPSPSPTFAITPSPTPSQSLEPTSTPTASPKQEVTFAPSFTPMPTVLGESTRHKNEWFKKFIKRWNKYIHYSRKKHHKDHKNVNNKIKWPVVSDFEYFKRNNKH